MSMAWLALGGMMYTLRLSTGGFPRPLTQAEEQHYLQLAAQGDKEARNILIERNLRLVAHIMKKYYASESDQEDLISIGTIGLIKAVSTYRMDKNIKLATYASRCIENATLTRATLRSVKWQTGAEGDLNGSFTGYTKRRESVHGDRLPWCMAELRPLPCAQQEGDDLGSGAGIPGRKGLNMTQHALAEYTGIPINMLRQWESGENVISRKSWERYFREKT